MIDGKREFAVIGKTNTPLFEGNKTECKRFVRKTRLHGQGDDFLRIVPCAEKSAKIQPATSC